jgi:hypothetical protein
MSNNIQGDIRLFQDLLDYSRVKNYRISLENKIITINLQSSSGDFEEYYFSVVNNKTIDIFNCSEKIIINNKMSKIEFCNFLKYIVKKIE